MSAPEPERTGGDEERILFALRAAASRGDDVFESAFA